MDQFKNGKDEQQVMSMADQLRNILLQNPDKEAVAFPVKTVTPIDPFQAPGPVNVNTSGSDERFNFGQIVS